MPRVGDRLPDRLHPGDRGGYFGPVAAGVISEAIYAGWRVRPVICNQVVPAEPVQPALTYRVFFSYYTPLVFTSLLTLLAQPIGSARAEPHAPGIGIPRGLAGVSGLVFMLRGTGVAYNEVVVALLDRAGSYASLRRFAVLLAALTTALLLSFAATPISKWWFEGVSALPPDLARMAEIGCGWRCRCRLLGVQQSWYQGTILYGGQTRAITESVAIYLATAPSSCRPA